MLLAILLALTAVRVIGLHTSVVDLFFDEAQYWAWSRDLAFGYFSKPPLLAWIIAASDHLCGSGEACLRLASPLFYLAHQPRGLCHRRRALRQGNCLLVGFDFCASDRRVFFHPHYFHRCAAAVFLGARPVRLSQAAGRAGLALGLVLGVALGFGLLAKYAMIYFALGVACAAWLDRDARDLLKRPQTWTAFAIAGF